MRSGPSARQLGEVGTYDRTGRVLRLIQDQSGCINIVLRDHVTHVIIAGGN
jgi:hypothetical protein